MITLFKPFMPDLPEMDAILHSGQLAYGQYTKDYEAALKKYFDTEYLFVTNSFNTAISVAVTALGISFGDEVIISPMACLASTQPYASSGLKIVWADVDNRTGTLNPDDVRAKITSRTKLIVHNHFCGNVGHIDEINYIGADYGIPVIDDGIECFGSEYKGIKVGVTGADIAVFSTTAVRIPNTVDGGIVICKDKAMYEKGLLIRECGIDRTIFRDSFGEISPACDISLTGFSATMSNLNGYIGLKQMEHVERIIEAQRRNAAVWKEKLNGRKDLIPLECTNAVPNYWVYGILCGNKLETIKDFRTNGYYASGIHINNNIYSVFGDKDYLPGVDDFYNHFVALPCGWWME